MIFGEEAAETLRDKLEEAIDEADEDAPRPAKGDLSPIERQMVRNLLHFGERDAGDVGVPRADIIGVEEQTSFADLIKLVAEAGHSRLPVYRGDMDTIVGMVHIKDVFNIVATGAKFPKTLEPLIRQPLFVPMSRGVLDLLADMRASRTHLAIVIDEYSGTEGLVTIEDLIEEIVGDIEDEHDEAPEAMLVPLDGGRVGCRRADRTGGCRRAGRPAAGRNRERRRHARRTGVPARGPRARAGRVPGTCQRLEDRGHRRGRAPRDAGPAASAEACAGGGRGERVRAEGPTASTNPFAPSLSHERAWVPAAL